MGVTVAQVENITLQVDLTTLFRTKAVSEELNEPPESIHTDELLKSINLDRHNLTVVGMAVEAGMMETNATALSQKQRSLQNEKKKKADLTHELILRLEEARQQAQMLRDLIDMRLEEIDTGIHLAETKLQTIEDNRDLISDALDDYERTGQFDLK